MSQAESPQRVTLTLAEVIDRYQEMRSIDIALARHGLTVFLAALLTSFAERPEVTIGAVARQFRFQPSVATGGLDRLEAQGLIRRIGRPRLEEDRRTVRVEVTEQGRAVLAAIAEIEVQV